MKILVKDSSKVDVYVHFLRLTCIELHSA